MDKDIRVAIGIQARSTSQRLPGKISRMIGNRSVIERVMDACEGCASYINRYSFSNHIHCLVFVLIPEGDPITEQLRCEREKIIEGDETDVLSRYIKMADETQSDFIVRVTADCPLIPHHVIFKAINVAVKNGLDYVSNVADLEEKMRTSIDGHDVEVMSRKALDWVAQNATEHAREHVTSLLRGDNVPASIRIGGLFGHVDLSKTKLSVDTEADLDRIIDQYESLEDKMAQFRRRHGKSSVYRF